MSIKKDDVVSLEYRLHVEENIVDQYILRQLSAKDQHTS